MGEAVKLCGWLQYHRSNFIVLRDWSGLVQLLIPEDQRQEAGGIPFESILEVRGEVIPRPEGQANRSMDTGDVEVKVTDIKVLNSCVPELPFQVKEATLGKVRESLRIKHRYLEMRLPQMQRALRTRSQFVMAVRNFLAGDNGFVEVETPTLFRRTPGGAREFIVPTHTPGKFYSLPQSPQQYKQLLMVGGLDRYFQIARCYRDEGSKPDRQPEFTQVDLEMSFVTQSEVMTLVETMLEATWPESCGQVKGPFPHLTYQEAMTMYGCDKPDLGLPWKVQDVTDVIQDSCESCPNVFKPFVNTPGLSIQALRIPGGARHFSNKQLDAIKQSALHNLGGGVKCPSVKVSSGGESWGTGLGQQLGPEGRTQLGSRMGVQSGDLVLFAAGEGLAPNIALGRCRLACADDMESRGGVPVREQGLHFLWVDTFPLFLPREDGSPGLECAHHPFTAPHPEDEQLVYGESPESVRSQHYDLVLNGSEVGGGSIRIHNSGLQRHVLREVLREDTAELEHLLEALDSGCPPHGGIALGLDRLLAIMLGADSIRDVIAFPKIQGGVDPLSRAPAGVSEDVMDYYNIKTNVGKSSE